MTQLDKHDLNWIVRKLPTPVRELMEKYGERLVLGGGFIRSCVQGERPNDVDLFVQSVEDAEAFAEELAGRKKVRKTDNTFYISKIGGYCVQLIHRWTFGSPEQMLESFDFTIACAAVWFKSPQPYPDDSGCKFTSLIDPRFYADLAAKRLVYLSPVREEAAGGSMLRVLKYYQRGFRMPLDSYGAVIARLVMGVDWKSIEIMEGSEGTRLGSTEEERLAKALTGLLVEVDPLADPTHAAHLPSMREDA